MNRYENNDLSELRYQMKCLKNELEGQDIINEKLLKDSMKEKMSWIKKYIIFEVCLMPVIILGWLLIRFYCHLSWANYFFVIILCMASIVIDCLINIKKFKNEDYNRANLVETSRKLVKMKRQRAIQMMVNIPILIVWLVWSGIEAYNAFPLMENDFQKGFIGGAMIGGPIGGIMGIIFAIKIFRKMQRTNDEIINQINDIINDK